MTRKEGKRRDASTWQYITGTVKDGIMSYNLEVGAEALFKLLSIGKTMPFPLL